MRARQLLTIVTIVAMTLTLASGTALAAPDDPGPADPAPVDDGASTSGADIINQDVSPPDPAPIGDDGVSTSGADIINIVGSEYGDGDDDD